MNCDISKVRPTPLVLPWKTDSDEESPLVKLPDDVFGRIISQLDTIDVFRMTLVCRSWKSLIHNNTKHLKRAEHAVTTHMITFTDWMDPASTFASNLKKHFDVCCRNSTMLKVSASISVV